MQTTVERDIARHGHTQNSDISQTKKGITSVGSQVQQKGGNQPVEAARRNETHLVRREMWGDWSNPLSRLRISHCCATTVNINEHVPIVTQAIQCEVCRSKPAIPALCRSNTLPTVYYSDSWTLHPKLRYMYSGCARSSLQSLSDGVSAENFAQCWERFTEPERSVTPSPQ